MDSRDITEQPSIDKGFLEHMFQMQKDLLANYIGIEGLPNYPVNINSKPSQILLKDFTGRIIEEMAEGFEANLLVRNLTVDNKLWFDPNTYRQDDYHQMINHLQNVGEEMADAIHFFLELLIYVNVLPEDIVRWVYKNAPNLVRSAHTSDSLTLLVNVGKETLRINYALELDGFTKHSADLHKLLDKGYFPYPSDLRYITCGRYYNAELEQYIRMFMWDVTYHLNIARNFLKNKPWKQTEVMTSEVQYQNEVVIAFIKFMGLLGMMNCDPQTIYFLYFKKNHVNQFRIKSKYYHEKLSTITKNRT